MRIIVLSDTHQNYRNLEEVIRRNLDADLFIHLGDGESESQQLLRSDPSLEGRFRYIKGNCDYGSEAPIFQVIDVMPGHRIFATHGHRYGVHASLETLVQAAKDNDCDIALYGHTHCSCNLYAGGMYVMNPGSASCPRDGNPPSFGCLDISDAGVLANIAFLTQKR